MLQWTKSCGFIAFLLSLLLVGCSEVPPLDCSMMLYRDSDDDGFGDPANSKSRCSAEKGYVDNSGDCDDQDGAIHPDADEMCDLVDNDCDGLVDEKDAKDAMTWYLDLDNDGYGDPSSASIQCNGDDSHVENDDDCDDSESNVNPSEAELCDGQDNDCDSVTDEPGSRGEVTWYNDGDGDGYGDIDHFVTSCVAPPQYVEDSLDCDDTHFTIHPGALEVCDELDNDCDNEVDEGVTLTWYQDLDADDFGNALVEVYACTAPEGYVDNAQDCKDTNDMVNPAADEFCNEIDDNCNGIVDDNAGTVWYLDADSDGFGDADSRTLSCSMPVGYLADDSDCNDLDPEIHPGSSEKCNLIDDNCDGNIDEDLLKTWYQDNDGDEYGNPLATSQACSQPVGYVSNRDDCRDTNDAVNPAAAEICNEIDDNCNGTVDESGGKLHYSDQDADGFGDPATGSQACSSGSNSVPNGGDCNDNAASINPAASEKCNRLDDDCDGLIDENVEIVIYQDNDKDGWGSTQSMSSCGAVAGYSLLTGDCNDSDGAIHPEATESCDGKDNDCDGVIDDDACTVFHALELEYHAPSGPANYISLSGELKHADGSYVWRWTTLEEVSNIAVLTWRFSNGISGDVFRGSVEYSYGPVSWGCTYDGTGDPNDASNFLVQGTIQALVDGSAVDVELTEAPGSDGCEYTVRIP